MTNPHDPINDANTPLHDRDLLISRVVDGRASASEWTTLESLAAQDSGVWRELAMAQRDQRAIETIVGAAGNLAESVDLPRRAEGSEISPGVSRMRVWGGWVAAAVLAFAAAGQFNVITQLNQKIQKAGLGVTDIRPVSLSADEAFDQYRNKGMQEGIVLGEIPDRVLLSAEPVAGGQGYEVTIVRQVIERRRVSDVLQFNSRNELGQTVPVPTSWTAPRRSATGL